MEMKFCSNCQKQIPESSFLLHQIHCEKNISRCVCGISIPKSEKYSHDIQYHTLVECQYCSVSMESFISSFHQCEKQPKVCKFCEGHFPIDIYSDHIFQCGSRTELCKVCYKYIPLRDYNYHTQEIDCRQYQMIQNKICHLEREDQDKELAFALAQIKEAEEAETNYKLRSAALKQTNSARTSQAKGGDYAEFLKKIREEPRTMNEESKENINSDDIL
ncbi:XAF1_5 [Blepharisma stoltei]|uniref:Uncharacterized protein n=1 Tax=Blepharisma stoltei TaxID=1481888 RepID=A0AAU9K4I9_9CILI|nr:unnamed protein product [Blepharisma stoltei]